MCRGPDGTPDNRLDLADKLTANDSEVPAADGAQIRREARKRLALLERIALRHNW